MKRKSEEIKAHIFRHIKKNKTQGHRQLTNNLPSPSYIVHGQGIVIKVLQEIIENAHQKIKMINHQQFIDSIIFSSLSMAQNISSFCQPPLPTYQLHTVNIDVEPENIAFDPICGFDKLITIKIDGAYKNQEVSVSQIKSKPYAYLQSIKKQQSTLKTMSTISKLIPLETLSLIDNQSSSEKQNQKQESFYRERICQNNLPLIVPEHKKSDNKSSKIGIDALKQNSYEDWVFDYNGQKTSLSAFSKIAGVGKQSSSNVLRTTYRIIDQRSDQLKKATLSKNRSSRFSNLFGISKQIIKNPNLKNENAQILSSPITRLGYGGDQAQAIKSLLQASFRQKEVTFRPIEKPHRVSKII